MKNSKKTFITALVSAIILFLLGTFLAPTRILSALAYILAVSLFLTMGIKDQLTVICCFIVGFLFILFGWSLFPTGIYIGSIYWHYYSFYIFGGLLLIFSALVIIAEKFLSN